MADINEVIHAITTQGQISELILRVFVIFGSFVVQTLIKIKNLKFFKVILNNNTKIQPRNIY